MDFKPTDFITASRSNKSGYPSPTHLPTLSSFLTPHHSFPSHLAPHPRKINPKKKPPHTKRTPELDRSRTGVSRIVTAATIPKEMRTWPTLRVTTQGDSKALNLEEASCERLGPLDHEFSYLMDTQRVR